MKNIIFVFLLMISALYANTEQKEDGCHFNYKNSFNSINIYCDYVNEEDQRIGKSNLFTQNLNIFKSNVTRELFYPGISCSDVAFNVGNDEVEKEKPGFKLKGCYVELPIDGEYKGQELELTESKQFSLLKLMDAVNAIIPESFYISNTTPILVSIPFDNNVLELTLYKSDLFKPKSPKSYIKRFDNLEYWDKMRVMYNGRFDLIGVPKKIISNHVNWKAKLAKRNILGLLEHKQENELLVIYKKRKNPLKIDIDFDNVFNYDLLLSSNIMLQARFEKFLEKLELGLVKGFDKNIKRVTFLREYKKYKKHSNLYSQTQNKKAKEFLVQLVKNTLKDSGYEISEQITARIMAIYIKKVLYE